MQRTGLWIPVLVVIVVGLMAIFWTRNEHDVPHPVAPVAGDTPVLTPSPDAPPQKQDNPEDHAVK